VAVAMPLWVGSHKIILLKARNILPEVGPFRRAILFKAVKILPHQ